MIKADGGGGALVYIVLAVISLVVSAIGKSKKKGIPEVPTSRGPAQQEDKPVEPQTTWQRELEDIFGKVLSEPEVSSEAPKHGPFSPSKKEAFPETLDPKVSELNKYAQSIDKKAEEARSDKHSELIAEEELHYSAALFEDFELSKAIVYAEVINRKYF